MNGIQPISITALIIKVFFTDLCERGLAGSKL